VDLALTGTEFRLLELLAKEPGTVLSRDALARTVLGRSLSPLDRSIDTHISNIRRKLVGVLPDTVDIKSLRGRGYVLSLARGLDGAR
jgi:two-component system response regulator CpxR